MADIGKSTTAHTIQVTESERNIERLLRNWGNWQALLSDGSPTLIAVQPMFREVIIGYRQTTGRVPPESADVAETFDRAIAALLTERDITCLYCHYVLGLSSRKASDTLKRLELQLNRHPRKSLRCSYRTYQTWLNQAVINAETALTFVTNVDLG